MSNKKLMEEKTAKKADETHNNHIPNILNMPAIESNSFTSKNEEMTSKSQILINKSSFEIT
jgi:hypothetical protein